MSRLLWCGAFAGALIVFPHFIPRADGAPLRTELKQLMLLDLRGCAALIRRLFGASPQTPTEEMNLHDIQARLRSPKVVKRMLRRDGLEIEIDTSSPNPSDPTGDFYHFVRLPSGELAIFFGDVMGHGLHPGAVSLFMQKLIMAPEMASVVQTKDPRATIIQLERMADQFATEIVTSKFEYLTVSLHLIFLNPQTGEYTATMTGGIPPLMIVKSDGTITAIHDHMGAFLTISVDSEKYTYSSPDYGPQRMAQGTLAPDETLLLFTDGMGDGILADGQFLELAIRKGGVQLNPASQSLRQIPEELRASVKGIRDDATILVLRRRR